MKHLHRLRTIFENNEAVIEVCKECKKKITYKKCLKTGRIDTKKYLEDHEVDYIQRGDQRFKKYYGKKK